MTSAVASGSSPTAGDQRLDLGGDPLGGEVVAGEHHRAGGVAAAVGGAEAERREDAAGARAEDALDPELGGDRRGVHRPGAAEGQQGEVARVDAALDGDHAQRAHHLLVGDADDPSAVSIGSSPSEAASVGDRGFGGVRVERDAAGQLRVGGEAAEQRGWRR